MMAANLNDKFESLMIGKIKMPTGVDELRTTYAAARPFPHVVLDGMFAERDLDGLMTEMHHMRGEQWLDVNRDTRERTVRMRSAAEMGPAGDRLLSIVHSASFLYLLTEITGIAQLLPDPYLQGAGYALMRRGDYFGVHADRNVAYDTGLVRRLAMIIFLNKSWHSRYHGELELWTPDGKRCEASIAPLFNKTVIFEVAHPNFHGVPTPLDCPPDRMRQSFITYYHTASGLHPQAIKPHTSIFAPRFYGSNRLTLRSFVRDLTPPLLSRSLRKLGKRE